MTKINPYITDISLNKMNEAKMTQPNVVICKLVSPLDFSTDSLVSAGGVFLSEQSVDPKKLANFIYEVFISNSSEIPVGSFVITVPGATIPCTTLKNSWVMIPADKILLYWDKLPIG